MRKCEFTLDGRIFQFQPLDAFTALDMQEMISASSRDTAFKMALNGRRMDSDFCLGIVMNVMTTETKRKIFSIAVDAGGYVMSASNPRDSERLDSAIFDGDIIGLQKFIAEYIKVNLADFFTWLDGEMSPAVEKVNQMDEEDEQA